MSLPRRDRILALAWSLPDALRALEGRSSETRRLSPAVWQLCVPCDGAGHVNDRWGNPAACQTCRGAGRYRSDPYADGQPVSGAGDVVLPRLLTRHVPCDRCSSSGVIPGRWVGASGSVRCPSCDGTGSLTVAAGAAADESRRLSGDDRDMLAWAFRGGDWDALDGALERMRSNGRRPLWRAFVAAYVESPYWETVDAQTALEHVDRLMPARIRVPSEVEQAWKLRHERERERLRKRGERMGRDHRNREIRAALRLGHTVDEVARMFAVSERTVRRVA